MIKWSSETTKKTRRNRKALRVEKLNKKKHETN